MNNSENISGIVERHRTINEAWDAWFNRIKEQADKGYAENSRDGEVVGELLNTVTIIEDPTRCILQSGIRKLPVRYLVGELLWYRSAKPTLDSIGLYTKAWERMSDDGETVNSNYGYCIKEKYGFDQWDYVKNMLVENPLSRQAVLHIKTADNTPSNDVNCTISCQFLLRDNKLYMTTYMRSNDLWMGFPNDIFQFTAMQVQMAMELGVNLGEYTHIAGSLHLYKRDYERALKNLAIENIVLGSE